MPAANPWRTRPVQKVYSSIKKSKIEPTSEIRSTIMQSLILLKFPKAESAKQPKIAEKINEELIAP